jgi:DNA repair exonuclease SbcCD nuclease subunit
MVNKNSDDIGISDLEDIKADYVFLGDYHQYQILPTKNTIAMYTGSIEKTDMSEIGQAKGYVVYDDDRDYDEKIGKTYFVEYTNCRPMIELKGNAKSIIDAITKLPEGMDGAIVKISFEGDRKELVDFSIALDSIRSSIKDKVDPVHMFSQQKIMGDNQIDKSESKLEDAVFEKGHLDEELVMKVVEELISEKESDLIEQAALIDLAKSIYKETLL